MWCWNNEECDRLLTEFAIKLMAFGNVIDQNSVWTRDEIGHLMAVIQLGIPENHSCNLCERLQKAIEYQKRITTSSKTESRKRAL